jgi:uncharacterized protein
VSIRFEWDTAKALANARKHGVSFELAERVFADPNVLVEQSRIEGGEYRWEAIGMVSASLLLFVAHTTRSVLDGGEIIRIVSARRAEKSERRRYEREFGQPRF